MHSEKEGYLFKQDGTVLEDLKTTFVNIIGLYLKASEQRLSIS